MRPNTLKLICLFAAVFFVLLFTGGFAGYAKGAEPVFEVPLKIVKVPTTVERGHMQYQTKRDSTLPHVVHVPYYWTSPVVYRPGIVTVQCRAVSTREERATFAAASWQIVPGSIDDFHGMLTLHVARETRVTLVACHWGFEGLSVPAGNEGDKFRERFF